MALNHSYSTLIIIQDLHELFVCFMSKFTNEYTPVTLYPLSLLPHTTSGIENISTLSPSIQRIQKLRAHALLKLEKSSNIAPIRLPFTGTSVRCVHVSYLLTHSYLTHALCVHIIYYS